MRVLATASLALASLLLPLAARAADNEASSIRLCVSYPVNRSFLNTSMQVAQNRLVYDINGSTQKKKAKVRVEAIAIESVDLRDAEAESRQKECSYVLLADFTNLDSVGGITGSNPTGSPTGFPPVIPNRSSQPRAGLRFRLDRVGGSTIDNGTLGPATGSDPDDAALNLLYTLSNRVVQKILKAKSNIDISGAHPAPFIPSLTCPKGAIPRAQRALFLSPAFHAGDHDDQTLICPEGVVS